MLRHRILPTYDALAEGIGADEILRRILSTVHAPRVSPSQDDELATRHLA